jgi:hypothetical protein
MSEKTATQRVLGSYHGGKKVPKGKGKLNTAQKRTAYWERMEEGTRNQRIKDEQAAAESWRLMRFGPTL